MTSVLCTIFEFSKALKHYLFAEKQHYFQKGSCLSFFHKIKNKARKTAIVSRIGKYN